MGRRKRPQPLRLARKLRRVREHLGLSQTDIVLRIAPHLAEENRGVISDYELGKRVPSLLEILAYARLARVAIEELVDDKLELPF